MGDDAIAAVSWEKQRFMVSKRGKQGRQEECWSIGASLCVSVCVQMHVYKQQTQRCSCSLRGLLHVDPSLGTPLCPKGLKDALMEHPWVDVWGWDVGCLQFWSPRGQHLLTQLQHL